MSDKAEVCDGIWPTAASLSGPNVIKIFMVNSTEHGISIAHESKMLQKIKVFLASKL